MRRTWKNVHPVSLRDALRLNKDYAREKRNLSVARIADLMGETEDSLYKWLATGRMPANLIKSYEQACGCSFVSRWLCVSEGKLVIDIPSGRAGSTDEMHALQSTLHETVGQLLTFYRGQADASAVLGCLQSSLESLAWHRQNVQQHESPQLDFGSEE